MMHYKQVPLSQVFQYSNEILILVCYVFTNTIDSLWYLLYEPMGAIFNAMGGVSSCRLL